MYSGETRKNGNGSSHKKAMFNGVKELETSAEGMSAQFRAMIDNAPLNFIYADEDFVIQYMNAASSRTLRTLEQYLPIKVDQIIGQNIDIFHKNPSHQRRLLSDHRRLPHTANIPLGPEILELMVAGIDNPDTGKMGFMVTWSIVTEKVKIERESARVNSMMENAPINVIFAERDLTIRYMNPASLSTLKKLQQHLPVRADDIVGQSIDIFHKNPAHQRRMLADVNNLPHRATIKLGPESLDLLVSPIFDGNREYIGTMVTWEVITERLAAAQREKDMQERERSQSEELRSKVDSILAVVEAAGKGDLTASVTVSGDDAIGQLGKGLSSFFGNLRTSIGEMAQSSIKLAGSSDGLTAISQQLSANAEETSTQANVVSAASEQVSSNVQSVATASEEMGASIREIAKNANEAAKIATSAVKVATTTNATVEKLGESSNEIGKVIKVITSIAQQTNLLALNATIEAARAGEAGKGFAVVANEVKELAKETARATEEIGQKIEAIQRDTRGAVEAISQIGSIIGQINDIQGAIASAVEEQTATANEIGRNVTEAAKGASEIAGNISGVAEAARSTTEGASDAQKAAASLADMAAGLQRLVKQFRI